MMNIIDLQEDLKDFPDKRLMDEMQRPTGSAPQFLVLSELQRRKRMRDDFKRQEASNMPTVAEEMIAGAGVPQEGLTAIAGAMAPKTNVAQDTGLAQAMPMQATRAPQPMADGGVLRLNQGSALSLEDLRALKAERRRLGVNDPHVITSIAAEDPFNPMTQYPTEKFGDLDLMQIAAMLQRGGNRDGLIANFGVDAVREAESMLSDESYLSIGQLPLGLGGQFGTLSKRELRQRPIKSYRDPSQSTYLGGESIQNVPANIESFIPELENPYEESEDIYSTLALDTAQAPELEDPYAEPEDPLRPKTGLGSNPAYTYETFLEENGLNDVPQAQEMFINYINYMNERGPTSDPRVYSPFLDDAPKIQAVDPSESSPSFSAGSDADPRLGLNEFGGMDLTSDEFKDAANTLYPEGIGTATQEFLKQRNADFGDESGGFDSIPVSSLAASSDDAEQRALEKSYEEQRESRSLSNQLKGGLANTAGLVKSFAGDVGPFIRDTVIPDIDFTAKAITKTFFGGEDETDASAEFIKTREQVLPDVPKNDNPDDKLPVTDPDPAGFGSTDSRIAKMLAERQKQSESNKWLALAEAGFKMMDSKSPTVLGAIGEGGQAGLKALSASKKGMQAFETDMLKLQTTLDAARIRSQGKDKTSATAYAALERAHSEALTLATQNPTAPNLARLKELEGMLRAARAEQFGTVTAGNTNSGVIKAPSAQT